MNLCEHVWVDYDRGESVSTSGKTIFVVHEFVCRQCSTLAMIVDSIQVSNKP